VNELPINTLIEFYKRAERFKKADEISIIVGLILTPILFFGIGISVIYFKSASFSCWVGYSIIVAGVLLFLFILFYRNRFRKRKPHMIIGKLLEIIKIRTRFGESASMLKIKISEAYELINEGKVIRTKKWDDSVVSRILVLKHFSVENELQSLKDETMFLCTPNGQVISYVIDGKLTEYVY